MEEGEDTSLHMCYMWYFNRDLLIWNRSVFLPIKANNQSRGMVYIHDYNIPDIEHYCNELKKEYSLIGVQKATWLKNKDITSTPLLMNFKQKKTAEIHRNPGRISKN